MKAKCKNCGNKFEIYDDQSLLNQLSPVLEERPDFDLKNIIIECQSCPKCDDGWYEVSENKRELN